MLGASDIDGAGISNIGNKNVRKISYPAFNMYFLMRSYYRYTFNSEYLPQIIG